MLPAVLLTWLQTCIDAVIRTVRWVINIKICTSKRLLCTEDWACDLVFCSWHVRKAFFRLKAGIQRSARLTLCRKSLPKLSWKTVNYQEKNWSLDIKVEAGSSGSCLCTTPKNLNVRRKWLGRSEEKFQGWSWKGGVLSDSEESDRGALLRPPPPRVLFPCPSPSLAPAVEGQPMTHCIMDFGVLGRPSSTCLTLTPTTTAAVTRLVWGRLASRWTSWQLNIGIIHMMKTRAGISKAVALR